MEVLFDIIVPTYNRYDQLGVFFERMKALKDAPVLFWIIDDASPVYRPEVIPVWKNIIHIRQEKNQGQTAARNVALDRGRAPYIISMDDDAWFEDSQFTIAQLPGLFDKYPKAGCLMFNLRTPDTPYRKTADGRELGLHVTCGCAYRRQALISAGGFNGLLHSQAEETDLSLRLFMNGWHIYFLNAHKVFHNFVPGQRTLQWYLGARRHTTRNDLLIVVMYYPWILIPPFLAGKFLSHLWFAVRNKVAILRTILVTFEALFQFMTMMPSAWSVRKGLSLEKFASWRRLVVQGEEL